MGLSVEVGILADLKDADEAGDAAYAESFEQLNEVLRAKGLGRHVEPDELDENFSCDLLGYSGIHYLRRIGVHCALRASIPDPGSPEALSDTALTLEYLVRFNAGENPKYQHLIMHSDAAEAPLRAPLYGRASWPARRTMLFRYDQQG
jgi:hypothetical protein